DESRGPMSMSSTFIRAGGGRTEAGDPPARAVGHELPAHVEASLRARLVAGDEQVADGDRAVRSGGGDDLLRLGGARRGVPVAPLLEAAEAGLDGGRELVPGGGEAVVVERGVVRADEVCRRGARGRRARRGGGRGRRAGGGRVTGGRNRGRLRPRG